jgi:3-hydroxyacyl-CoA dehydrogenase/enoyl-CoA hydratase/3-hydroxybutyryl-CoA epimerase
MTPPEIYYAGRPVYLINGNPVISRRIRRAFSSADLEERLFLRMFNEAVACWREKTAADADLIDAGVIFGAGFAPFRGGPLRHIRSTGVAFLHERLNTFAERYGRRFTPDAEWSDLPPDDSGSQ